MERLRCTWVSHAPAHIPWGGCFATAKWRNNFATTGPGGSSPMLQLGVFGNSSNSAKKTESRWRVRWFECWQMLRRFTYSIKTNLPSSMEWVYNQALGLRHLAPDSGSWPGWKWLLGSIERQYFFKMRCQKCDPLLRPRGMGGWGWNRTKRVPG